MRCFVLYSLLAGHAALFCCSLCLECLLLVCLTGAASWLWLHHKKSDRHYQECCNLFYCVILISLMISFAIQGQAYQDQQAGERWSHPLHQNDWFHAQLLCHQLDWQSWWPQVHTAKKENKIFLIYEETQNGAAAKSYMTNGLLIYEEIFAHSSWLGSPSSYMTLQLLHSEFPYIWGKLDFLFYQCTCDNSSLLSLISTNKDFFWRLSHH